VGVGVGTAEALLIETPGALQVARGISDTGSGRDNAVVAAGASARLDCDGDDARAVRRRPPAGRRLSTWWWAMTSRTMLLKRFLARAA